MWNGSESGTQPVMKQWFAVVYIRRLVNIPKDHPLYDIVYIGQALRWARDAVSAARERWRAENSLARRTDHVIGHLAALKVFGADAFVDEVVDFISGEDQTPEMSEFMNREEMANIAKYGGVLQNMERRLNQTLNLTRGGSGAKFEYFVALKSYLFKIFHGHLVAYVEREHSALVPTSYVTPCGYPLGKRVVSVRFGAYWSGHPEMKNMRSKLETLPNWWWDSLDSKWDMFQKHMIEYVDAYGTSLVPHYYTTSDGYTLGNALVNVRYGNLLQDKKDRIEWVEKLPNWTWNTKQDKWPQLKEELQEFVETYGTSSIPLDFVAPSGYKLGFMLQSVRCHDTHLSNSETKDERIKWLESLPGWYWNYKIAQSDKTWLDFQREMTAYVEKNRTSIVYNKYVSPSGFKLGELVNRVRMGACWKGSVDEESRVAWIESLPKWAWRALDSDDWKRSISGFNNGRGPADDRDGWKEFQKFLNEYIVLHGHCNVPAKYKTACGYRLGNRVSDVRLQGRGWKGSENEAERKAWLESLPGWAWDRNISIWQEFQKKLTEYVDENLHSMVPGQYVDKEGFKLGKKVAWVRSTCTNKEQRAWLETLPYWVWKMPSGAAAGAMRAKASSSAGSSKRKHTEEATAAVSSGGD